MAEKKSAVPMTGEIMSCLTEKWENANAAVHSAMQTELHSSSVKTILFGPVRTPMGIASNGSEYWKMDNPNINRIGSIDNATTIQTMCFGNVDSDVSINGG